MAFARPIIVPAIGPSRIQTAAVSIMQIITGQSELIWISLGLILGFGRYLEVDPIPWTLFLET